MYGNCCTLIGSHRICYSFPLDGTCTAPKPKGPFVVKHKKPTIINFTNPFLIDYCFKYLVEPDIFIPQFPEEVLPAKQATKLNINLSDKFTSDEVVNGKLIILPIPQLSENIKWTYYLKGMQN